ncbi:MAG: bacillithiol biosynthesis cysteine-adding enzyme BshC [Acidobacteria bacterium]|nr:bacillithiol biosynthesis cysteine-adding enzyme BshC [Acidobacteriota bacterium]
MPSQPDLSSTATRFPVEIRRLPWIKALASDYAFDFARVADFFAGDPAERTAWTDAIARAQRHPRQRDAIADILLAQQRARAASPEARAAAERLRDPSTVAMVTGQQAGLFGGPLFTLLKALTVLQLAERTAADHGVPTVAIFWIDAEDHDWHEIKSCGLLDADVGLTQVALDDPSGAGHGPVAGVLLDDGIDSATASLASMLPATEFTPALLESVRRAYRPGVGMAQAFGTWLESLLGPRGLVVFDASDPAAKPLVSEIFAREIATIGDTSRLAVAAGVALTERGYHAQVTPQEGSAALFHLGGGRESIRLQGDQLFIGDTAATREAMLERARRQPAEFSPNVLLRPVVQDTLFPTCCFVAGPNELGYLAQLRSIYAAFDVPMPLIHQRSSATLLDANAMRFLSRYAVPLESLRAQDESELNRLLGAQIPAEAEQSIEETVRAVDEHMDAVATALARIDTTLDAAARSTRGRMQDDVKKLRGKLLQAVKRKNDTVRRQFLHAQAQAFPGGHPQERGVGFVYFLNKYGDGLVDRLCEELPLDQGRHWVMTL